MPTDGLYRSYVSSEECNWASSGCDAPAAPKENRNEEHRCQSSPFSLFHGYAPKWKGGYLYHNGGRNSSRRSTQGAEARSTRRGEQKGRGKGHIPTANSDLSHTCSSVEAEVPAKTPSYQGRLNGFSNTATTPNEKGKISRRRLSIFAVGVKQANSETHHYAILRGPTTGILKATTKFWESKRRN